MPCTCEGPGFCKTHDRYMNEVRFLECRDKPGYFEVFQDAKNGVQHRTDVVLGRVVVEQWIGKGPGTELILMLASPLWKRLGIEVTTGCKCVRHASMMNEQVPDWCVENIEVIIGWLSDEHNHQRIRMPFLNTVAVIMVRTAIKRSRKRRDEHSRQSDPDADQ